MTLETKFQLHLDVENSQSTAVEILSSHCELSKQRIKQAMKNGSVWLTRNQSTFRLRRAKKKLCSGDQIHLYYDFAIQEKQATKPTLLEDHNIYSIWYKPRGMFSQGSKWGDHCSIARWIETHHLPQRPAFTIHRLDRATSGIILIAHSKKTAAFLARQFEKRQVHKRYLAITSSPYTKTSFSVRNELGGKKAISHFKLLDYQKPYSLFDISIETGRKHQIRKHLAQVNMPIVGDRLYGGGHHKNTTNNTPDLQLTAYKITFLCPVTRQAKTLELTSEYHLKINS